MYKARKEPPYPSMFHDGRHWGEHFVNKLTKPFEAIPLRSGMAVSSKMCVLTSATFQVIIWVQYMTNGSVSIFTRRHSPCVGISDTALLDREGLDLHRHN